MAKETRAPRSKRLAAVVLSRTNYGEADLIVTFLTRELGLVSALARYGRRSLRRFGGGLLSPGASAWYDFTIKPASSLAFVEKGEEDPKAPRLAPDPVVQSLAAFSLEMVRGFEAPGNPAAEAFNLLVRHLGRLARAADERMARLVSLDFSLKYLELAGFGPRLSGCILCGAAPEAEPGWRWEPAAGGLYCPACAGGAPRGRLVSPALLARLSPRAPGEEYPPLDDRDLAEAELFFEKLAEHHLGRTLKAMKVARRLFGNS
ncbi:MAG: DNA repair protein RecO [Candidatus Adiutrix sp.]|jgi:DNA repair protein RecO (recombination protein O)|nr:DNA repair protein RecO [Candidatus Adiutrix sp.]